MQKNGTTRTLQTVKDADGSVTSRVRRTVLPSGLRVVTEQMAGVRSASVGVWVDVGSRDETPALHGCSHFLEHLLFKGTPSGSAMDISVALDAVGGEFNAFTAKEYTCFHARVLDEDLPTAVDVLGDMVTASTITADDVEAERDVILDEIAMHDDDPDDVVHNLFAHQAWGDSPLGPPDRRHRRLDHGADARADPPLLPPPLPPRQHGRRGRRQRRPRRRRTPGDEGLRPQRLPRRRRHPHGRRVQTERARKVQAGEARTVRALRAGQPGARRAGPDPHRPAPLRARRAQHRARRRHVARGCSRRSASTAAWPTPSTPSPPTTPTPAWSGSRWAACPASTTPCWRRCASELAKVAADGITEEELERGKGQLQGGLVLGLEDSGSRMSRIGKAELVHDELLTIDEVVRRIDAVTLERRRRAGPRALHPARDPGGRRPRVTTPRRVSAWR